MTPDKIDLPENWLLKNWLPENWFPKNWLPEHWLPENWAQGIFYGMEFLRKIKFISYVENSIKNNKFKFLLIKGREVQGPRSSGITTFRGSWSLDFPIFKGRDL